MKPIFYLFLSVLLSLTLDAQAQTSGVGFPGMKGGQMSDQQMMQLWQQAQRAGMSETDAMNMFVRSGMSPTDVEAFRKRLLQMNNGGIKTSQKALIKDTSNMVTDSSWIKQKPVVKKKARYFGHQFFSNPRPLMQPNLLIATPKNYILGPGDELSLTITGINTKEITALVNLEGNVQVEYAGLINVSGLTIEQATQKIRNKLTSIYPALTTGATKLFVSLNNIRSIRVTVVGEAQVVGDFIVSSLASVMNLLYLSGGPSDNGSLRNIELIRNNKVVETIDFYEFLTKGTFSKNIRLEDRDILRYPLYQKRVVLDGEVKRPMIFELTEKETFSDLLNFGGGTTEYAITDAAKIVQVNNRNYSVRDLPANDFPYFIPRNGDSVYFSRVADTYQNLVTLSGAVHRPGNYELTDNLTLTQLIKKADGVTENAFLNRGLIKRQREDANKEMISFNIKDVLDGKQDIKLVKNDSIIINTKSSLKDELTITVAGAVRNPTTFVFREGMTIEDAILLAGGLNNDAANHKIEISRLEKNKSDTLANRLLEILTVSMDSSLQTIGSKVLLRPMDYIFVPQLLNYKNLGNIKLRGEVLYAGDYALERRNESVQEVIQRAGGITPYASLSDVQVYRNGLRVATNLLKENSSDSRRFLLQPDDSIYIPRNEPFVEVQGAVFNPQILSFESKQFLSYITNSGGVTDNANLKRAYIQYSNGISKKVNRFLFFRAYPKVLPGSKIIVPEKSGNERRGISIFELSAITGSLSALISLISVLK